MRSGTLEHRGDHMILEDAKDQDCVLQSDNNAVTRMTMAIIIVRSPEDSRDDCHTPKPRAHVFASNQEAYPKCKQRFAHQAARKNRA